MKRKNHNKYGSPTDFRISKDLTEKLPFRLLESFTHHTQGDINEFTIDNLASSIASIRRRRIQAQEEVSVDTFRALYQAESLLSKYPFPGNKDECRTNAIAKFLQAEEVCKSTNYRLTHLVRPMWLCHVREHARSIISSILGPLDVLSLVKRSQPGPGLTHDLGMRSSSETTKFFKYTDDLSCTKECLYYAKGMIALDPRWLTTFYLKHETDEVVGLPRIDQDRRILSSATYVVPGNRITFVPKNSTTDRTIAIEPSGNVMLQLGVGSYIKDRLLPYGVNLKDQSKNRRFAYEGSLEGFRCDENQFSTIDFSMASDTLSLETVRDLLPYDWFAYLSDLRSHEGQLTVSKDDIRTIKYEKFSSMGNGYTFELESLIFFALSYATMKHLGFEGRPHQDITVFGDDLIVRHPFTPQILEVLSFYGFSVNTDKSYLTGAFKESCGCDYLNGVDVRPFFLKRKIRTLRDLHFCANSLMYRSLKHRTPIFWKAYEILFHAIPKHLKLPGPLHFDVEESTRFVTEDKHDDLESCLRVPLSWALSHGYYNVGRSTHSLGYRRLVCSPIIFTRKYDKDSYTLAGRYHTFLQGVRQGDIVLRGRTQERLKWAFSSRWDGTYPSEVVTRYSPVA